jgi:hypothetical protein
MHISFRDIGPIINKIKLQAKRERGYINDKVDTQPPEDFLIASDSCDGMRTSGQV